MNETLSASNQQTSPSNMCPTWANSATRRNTGSVHPVHPVQPFLKNYKINEKARHRAKATQVLSPRKLFVKIPWTGWTCQIRLVFQCLTRTLPWT
jgi:hypothetical protein